VGFAVPLRPVGSRRPVVVLGHGGERILPEPMTKAFDRLGASIQQWAYEQRPHRSGRSASPGQSVSYAIQAEQARELRAIRQDLRRLGKEIGAGVRTSGCVTRGRCLLSAWPRSCALGLGCGRRTSEKPVMAKFAGVGRFRLRAKGY
jgi:hypothetical protein